MSLGYVPLQLEAPFGWNPSDDPHYYKPGIVIAGDEARLRGKVTMFGGTHVNNGTVNVKTIAMIPQAYMPTMRKAFTVFWDTSSPLYFGSCSIILFQDRRLVLVTPDVNQPYPFTEGHICLDGVRWDLA